MSTHTLYPKVTPDGDLPPKVVARLRTNAPEVNVKTFGAVGDGVSDDLASIRAAAAATPAGGTLRIPQGHYRTTYGDPTIETSYLVIDQGVTVVSDGAVLENFLIFVKGQYGPLVNIGAQPTLGDKSVSTAAAHGLVAGDYFQILSNVNAYSPDAGEWQLGSVSPTDGTRPQTRFAEIHTVARVNSTTTVELHDEVVYPTHRTSTSGLAHPIAGVSTSQVRKLTMVKGVTFKGITFRNETANYRCIAARAAADLTFEDCRFETGSNAGSMVKATDCYNVNFIRCTTKKALLTYSGSSWNTFFIGGGCHGVHFTGCSMSGEAQGVDFTPQGFSGAADIGSNPATGDTWRTVQFMTVTDSEFFGGGDAITSHPGSYLFKVRDCLFIGGSTGIRARSRATTIQGCTIHTGRAGISLSAFHDDTLVSDNSIVQRVSGKYSGFWTGVGYTPTSSEILTNNAVKNLRIVRNVIRATSADVNNSAVFLNHFDSAQPEFDNAVKVSASDIVVADNDIVGCSVVVARWVNQVRILGNRFSGGSDRAYYVITQPDSARNTIADNTFADILAGAIQTGGVTLTGHGYDTAHAIGEQLGLVGPVGTALGPTRPVFTTEGRTVRDAVTVSNNTGLFSRRDAGSATLNLDAVPGDGSSASTVNVFRDNTSSGVKLLDVNGRIGLPGSVRILSGAGSPEGSVSAGVGSVYLRLDGGSSTTLYVKTSGTGSTGWTAK